MKKPFIIYRLKDVCDNIFSGGTPDTRIPEYWGGIFLWLSSGETRNRFIRTADKSITQKGVDNSSTRLAIIGDVVVASAGQGRTRGQTSFVLVNTYINQSLIALRADRKKLNPLMLFYFLSGRYEQLRNLSDANSIRGSLTCKLFENMELSIPEDINSQNALSSILYNYDLLIDNNNRRIQILESMAKLVYDEWFVKLRFPGHESAIMIDSEMGKIPDGWKVRKIEEFAVVTSSKRIYMTDYVENGVPFYRSKEIIQLHNHMPINTELFISKNKYDEIKSKFGVPSYGDILLTSVGTLGTSYLVNTCRQFYFKDGNLIWLKMNNNEYGGYLYYWMNSELGKNSLLNTSIGTSQAAFTIANIKQIKIVQPPQPLCSQFQDIISALHKLIDILVNTNSNLSNTREMLLSRLLSGEIDISDLDIQVTEVEA